MLKLWFKRSFQVTFQGSVGKEVNRESWSGYECLRFLGKWSWNNSCILKKSSRLKKEAYIRSKI